MGGLYSFFVVALAALYETPATIANVALSALLLMNALGVLIGGVLASRTDRHAMVAAVGLGVAGLGTGLLAVVGFSSPALIALAAIAGLFVGIASPLARHAGSRRDAARGVRSRLRLCFVRLQHRRHDRPDRLRHADGSRATAGRISVFGDLQHCLHRHGGVWLFGPAATRSRSLVAQSSRAKAFRRAWKTSRDVLNEAVSDERRGRKPRSPRARELGNSSTIEQRTLTDRRIETMVPVVSPKSLFFL